MSVPARIPEGARPLGVRLAPQLRLAMGYRDEERRGAPVKTDYFIPKRGAQGEYGRQADKFLEVFGEKPKSVRIQLPPELRHALTITYKAWGSSGDDEGGVLKAIGHTNFALEDYMGGPDVLTIWNPDGTVTEVETAGLDAGTGDPLDDVARGLGLDLYTTFRFMIPDVLGFGSFAEITSKGRKTTDNLWGKLQFYYGLFGAKVTLALDPLYLILRPDTARPVVKKDGESKRIKSNIFVLDLVPGQTQQEMIDLLGERQAAIDGRGGPAAVLYGDQKAIEGSARPGVDERPAETPAADDGGEAAADTATAPTGGDGPAPPEAAAPASDPEEPTFEPAEDASPFVPPDATAQDIARAAVEAGLVVFSRGAHQGMTIAQVHEELTTPDKKGVGEGEGYIRYCVRTWKSEPEKSALAAYCRAHFPDALAEGQAA